MSSRLAAREAARSWSRSLELEAQVGGLLFEVGDFVVQGVDVGGCAEP